MKSTFIQLGLIWGSKKRSGHTPVCARCAGDPELRPLWQGALRTSLPASREALSLHQHLSCPRRSSQVATSPHKVSTAYLQSTSTGSSRLCFSAKFLSHSGPGSATHQRPHSTPALPTHWLFPEPSGTPGHHASSASCFFLEHSFPAALISTIPSPGFPPSLWLSIHFLPKAEALASGGSC